MKFHKSITIVFLFLSLATIFTIIHLLMFIKTPKIEDPNIEKFYIEGYNIIPYGIKNGWSNKNFSYSSTKKYKLIMNDDQSNILNLSITSIHSRESSTFSVPEIIKDISSTSKIEIEISNPSICDKKDSKLFFCRTGENFSIQTCMTQNGDFWVEKDALTDSVNRNRSRSPLKSFNQVLGIEGNIRWECLLIVLSGPSNLFNEDNMQNVWNMLHPNLIRWKSPKQINT